MITSSIFFLGSLVITPFGSPVVTVSLTFVDQEGEHSEAILLLLF